MIAAAVDLQIGPAGERGGDPDDDLSGPCGGDRGPLKPQIFFAVQDSSVHDAFDHPYYLLTLRSPPTILGNVDASISRSVHLIK
jgi:hypothetical protein